MACRIKRRMKSDIRLVKDVVDDILSDMQGMLSDVNLFNVKLILSELIINGVKHGNNEDSDKLLIIDVSLNSASITIRVSDEGSGIRYEHRVFDENDYSESGRGLMLVEGLSDKFAIKGSTVTCVRYFR